jgi:anion exchange protein
MMNGTVLLDMKANNLTEIVDLVVENMVRGTKQLVDDDDVITTVKQQLLASHEHQFEHHKHKKDKDSPNHNNSSGNLNEKEMKKTKSKNKFAHHVPKGSEASNILVGTLDCLEKPVMAFVRLQDSTIIEGLCEVDIPTRFMFILLGNPSFINYYQIGRSMSTLMSDEIFHEVAYKSRTRKDLLAGIDEFLDKTTVLPPGEWDPRIRIEPPSHLATVDIKERLNRNPDDIEKHDPDHEIFNHGGEHGVDDALTQTGVLFGGLIKDVKRKMPFYLSDFKDCLSLQCISSAIFLYFAVITPVITFGGLWGDATNQEIGAMESILGAAIAGVAYHMFSGQPLTIIGATGPILVFDTIMYTLCSDTFGIPFLPFRAWVGLWTGVLCLIIVAFDLSYLVKYITRYTEESFSTLISLIFIVSSVNKILGVNNADKMWTTYDKNDVTQGDCTCAAPMFANYTAEWTSLDQLEIQGQILNFSKQVKDHVELTNYNYLYLDNTIEGSTDSYRCFYDKAQASTTFNSTSLNYPAMQLDDCKKYCGVPVGDTCGYTRDVFLFSVFLSLGTYFLSTTLKAFKTTPYFPTKFRQVVSDFAVITAIIIMVAFDMWIGISTPKLMVPNKFEPTNANYRGWYIPMFGGSKGIPAMEKYWALVAIVPAILATILVFLDQQITAVIVNRRENKLNKGVGYHLDLFIVAIMIIICSCWGLPWFVAATVLSITHVNSLKQESETSAPGEKPQFLGVREQRVTGLCIFLLIGSSIFMTSFLTYIPMPVLYGVFLYMGLSSLNGVQLVDRLKLLLMPGKHQPDYVYVRHVPLKRIHMFTAIQVGGLALLWIIKKTPPYSIAFPLMVAAIVVIRMSFDWFKVFTQRELSWLDDVMPEENKKVEVEQGFEMSKDTIDLSGKKKKSAGEINISKQMNNSNMWKTINKNEKVKEMK